MSDEPRGVFTAIESLDQIPENGTATGDSPDIRALAHLTGATVIRIGFRAGQGMAEHQAQHPIIVLGQRGEVEFDVDGETIRLVPGTAVHVEAKVTHSLRAVHDAAVTLLVLTPKR